MSRADPLRDNGYAANPDRPEPSMDEILASIRRIIADNQTLWASQRAPDPEIFETDSDSFSDRRGEAAREDGGGATLARAEPALASAATEASVESAFNALVASRFARNTEFIAELTREMIRPMLEAWIDEHLPALVERLVAAEIERMTRQD